MDPAIKLKRGDVADVPCDVLLLKHADGFHGADRLIANRIGFDDLLQDGEWKFWPGRGVGAKSVLFGGVGPLWKFRYEAIRLFARDALLQIGARHPEARSLACTIHGPGYGLDEKEAFQALLAGLLDGASDAPHVHEIQIVELDAKRVQRLKPVLRETLNLEPSARNTAEIVRPNFASVGKGSERKPLFVAMPFSEDFDDEYNIAFSEAATLNGFLCERADLASFTGDIVDWVRQRIETSAGLIALMNTANANVFLEIGYAWAKGIPTILAIKKGEAAPFNVKGQRFIEYRNIGDLRGRLTVEIAALKQEGMLTA